MREDLLVRLVRQLAARDTIVAVAIDDPTATIDRANKDTGRHQAAGAVLTLGSSPHHSSLIGKRVVDDPLDTFLAHMEPAEVILVSEQDTSSRKTRLIIQTGAPDTEDTVTLHSSGGAIANSPLADITAIADLVTHHLNGPTS
jgi:molybdopterin-guanine dinucleotide biosynthesis protein MobB